jgi:ADP-dependent NAD(P)H-hydrate dehydratase / NAD(P)H-hydrate epimerase
MTATGIPLLDAASAGAGDAAAVAAGVPAEALMARAAGHLARTVLEVAGRAYGLRIDVLVGPGDNGGDGWAAAALLSARGAQVRVVPAEPGPAATKPRAGGPAARGAAASARAAWTMSGGRVALGEHAGVLVDAAGRARADVVVDCLLGTGAAGPLRGGVASAAAAIHAAQRGGARVVACDLPSGVSADDGSAVEGAVVAEATVSLGGLKRGLVLAPGAIHAGVVSIGRLGTGFAPPDTGWTLLTAAGARPVPLDPRGDKRTRGTVLIVAGRIGSAGAAVLAGTAALAAGAGLVTLAVPEAVRAEVATGHPALMVVGLLSDSDGALHPDAVPELDRLIAASRPDVIVAGPGLGTGVGASAVVTHLRQRTPVLVLDADALNIHRDDPMTLADHAGVLVLTPHAGELDRLGGPGTYVARAVRVPELARRWGAVIVAKGPGTFVADPQGRMHVAPLGTPALGTAGTGDVLAGAVAAALARLGPARTDPVLSASADGPVGVSLAVAQAVWWHAAAGVRSAERRGSGMVATDVVASLPRVLSELARQPITPADPGPTGRVALEPLLATGVRRPRPARRLPKAGHLRAARLARGVR